MTVLTLAFTGWVLPARPARGQTPAAATQPARAEGGLGPAAQRAERSKKLAEALKPLMEEANALDQLDVDNKVVFHWTRPHPALKSWSEDMAVACLDRMQQPFTRGEGAEYRDTYIRWHLMWVVKQAAQKDKAETGPRLMALIRKLPKSIEGKWKQEYFHEPEKLYNQWYAKVTSGRIVVGYKPFERVVDPPASYAYLSADAVAKSKADIAEAAELYKKITFRTDQKAIAFNSRIRQLNYIIRQYRGELLYSLILTGYPDTAKAVMSENRKKVEANDPVAFDLLAYFYLAAFDGALNLYDQSVLTDLSKELKSFSIKNQKYELYGGAKRNFAEYSFHLIYMLEDGGGFIDPKEAKKLPNRRYRNRD
jgi:hypothetical protein